MRQYMPLYAQVRAELVRRLSGGVWAPGTALPSEIALAAELNVSQGTARKAIDSLVADGALTRIQGRGTFVAEQTAEMANFRFLRITDQDGERVIPDLLSWNTSTSKADEVDTRRFDVPKGSTMHKIQRTRTIAGKPAILETIRIPDAVMPGLSETQDLPNALYPWYQSAFGVTVLRTEDDITAVGADATTASALSLPEGTPLLKAVRTAFDLTDRAVEHRVSQVLTDGHAFSVTLS